MIASPQGSYSSEPDESNVVSVSGVETQILFEPEDSVSVCLAFERNTSSVLFWNIRSQGDSASFQLRVSNPLTLAGIAIVLLADHQKRLRSPKLRDKCGKLWKKEACYERTDIVGRVHHIVSYGRGTRSFVYASETYVYKRLSDSASFRNECQWQIMNEGRSVAVFSPVW